MFANGKYQSLHFATENTPITKSLSENLRRKVNPSQNPCQYFCDGKYIRHKFLVSKFATEIKSVTKSLPSASIIHVSSFAMENISVRSSLSATLWRILNPSQNRCQNVCGGSKSVAKSLSVYLRRNVYPSQIPCQYFCDVLFVRHKVLVIKFNLVTIRDICFPSQIPKIIHFIGSYLVAVT